MREIRRDSNTTLFIVSHALTQVSCLANRVLWLDHGQMKALGDPSEVIVAYTKSQGERMMRHDGDRTRGAPVEFLGCEFEGEDGTLSRVFRFRAPLRVRIRYRAHRRCVRPYFALSVRGIFGNVLLASMILDGNRPVDIDGDGEIVCHFRELLLLPGTYQVACQVNSEDNLEVLTRDECIVGSFVVESPMADYGFNGPLAAHVSRYATQNYADYRWEFPGQRD